MVGVNYGDARYSAPYTDPDPNVSGNILLMYNRASVSGTWSTSPLIWNREHIWPQSLLGTEASNGTVNIASDQFNLRPADDGINSNRGNDPYGLDGTTGHMVRLAATTIQAMPMRVMPPDPTFTWPPAIRS